MGGRRWIGGRPRAFVAGLALVAVFAGTAPSLAATPAAATPGTAPPAPSPSAKVQASPRIQRLAALGRLWGAVRYLHPALATRDLDWDRALVEAIPRVNAARDAAQYRAAVQSMLDVLGDPATRVEGAAPPPAAPVRTGALVSPMVDGVLRADLARIAGEAQAQGGSRGVLEAAAKLADAAAGARVLVLDARTSGTPVEDWTSGLVFLTVATRLTQGPLRLGSARYRSYSGYPQQAGDPGSGGYSSALRTDTPEEIAGAATAPGPAIVLVTDARSVAPGELISGLQAIGRLHWIAESGPGGAGALPATVPLADGLVAQVRSIDVVAPDGVETFAPDHVSAPDTTAAAIEAAVQAMRAPRGAVGRAAPRAVVVRADRDRPYADMAFPSSEYRLLALFRFWNVMQRFFPYRELIGPGWDDVLERYIPELEANRDAADYQLTLRRLTAETHDSHVGPASPMLASAERLGRYSPPALLRFVEGESVVVALVEDNTGLRVGDRIVRVDGRPVAEQRAATAQYRAASTPQAAQRDLHRNLLRGQPGSRVALDVVGLDGVARRGSVARSIGPDDRRLQDAEFKPRPQPVFGVLPSGFGYVDLDRLTPGQVDAMFTAIAGTKATIFDMRGYPNGTAWPVAPRLTTKRTPVAAAFRRPLHVAPEVALDDGNWLQFEQRLPEPKGAPYLGKVVMLIDENAQSQAEHTGLFFEAATDVTFIGTPTAGANGDVTQLVLPGGHAISFSGHDVRHADGRQLQRLGLQPHVRVAPTIAGLARGEDEVLAAAEAWLRAHPAR